MPISPPYLRPSSPLPRGFQLTLSLVFPMLAFTVLLPSPARAQANACDLNRDSAVDTLDLGILLSRWGSSSSFPSCGNGGTVDVVELGALLSAWGGAAPLPQCRDRADNDGDGKTDYPDDPGCSSPEDRSETDSVVDPRKGHTYPRKAVYVWCCEPAEYYAMFDLVLTRDDNPDLIAEIKRLNPNVKKLVTEDINCGDNWFPNKPDSWLVRDSQGNALDLPGYCRNLDTPNLSDLSGYANAFAQEAIRRVAASGADGYMTDGLFYTGHYGWYGFGNDIDLDQNGLNDLAEPGKGESWALTRWGAGVDQMINTIRSGIGNDKLLVVNTGSQDCPNCAMINGLYFEHVTAESNWAYTRDLTATLENTVSPPPIFVLNIHIDPGDPESRPHTWNNMSYIRFAIARSMLLGQYLQLESWEVGEHNWTEYVDEYDLNVGYPKGSMAEIASGVWARVFDTGAVIGNFNNHDVTVTNAQLQSAPGYAGPYHRFKGCQDPAVNDGSLFDSINLRGHSYIGYQNHQFDIGDGIVLVDRANVSACPTIPPRPPNER